MIKKIAIILFLIIFITVFGKCLFAEDAAFAYNSMGKRDPFIPLFAEKSKSSTTSLENVQSIEDVALEGLAYDAAGGSIVILNGIVVSESEKVGNVKVLKVSQTSVMLSINGIEYNLDFE